MTTHRKKLDGTRHDTVAFLAWCCLLAGSAPSSAEDWPAFRGPRADGTTVGAEIPLTWSDREHLQWKYRLPGKGFSSPIVVGSHVLVTCYSDAEPDLSKLKRHLVCLDRKTGEVEWTKTVPALEPEQFGASFGTRHGFASHTPASDGKSIYVLFGNSGVFAFDMEGRQRWHRKVGTMNAGLFGSASSPIVHDGRLIVTAASESSAIVALDTKDGRELWKAKADPLARCYSTPVVAKNSDGEEELLVQVPFELWSLRLSNGKLRWYAETGVDTNAVPNVVVDDNIAYVIGGRSGARAAVGLGGKGDVTKTHRLWATSGGSYVPSPVLYEGHLYWVNDRGIAHCVDAKTGKLVHRRRIGGSYYASLVRVNDRLYAVSRFDGTRVLQASPNLKELAHNKLSDDTDFSASPAVSDRQLFLRSQEWLYCIQ